VALFPFHHELARYRIAGRGVNLTYETVRCRANKFGPAIAANILRKRGRADSVWHLDEMVVRINGERMYM